MVDHAVVGLFPESLFECVPARFATLDGAGAFTLGDVPAGTWYVLAHSTGRDLASREQVVLIGVNGPVRIGRGVGAHIADIGLRRRTKIDPPLLTPMSRAELRGASHKVASLRDAT